MKTALLHENEIELGDIASVLSGFAFKSELFNEQQIGIPLIRIRDLENGESNTYYSGEYKKDYLVEKNDLLISMDGEFKIFQWKSKCSLLNQRVCKIFVNEKLAIPKYVFYIISKKLKEIEDKTPFVTVKHISVKQILSIKLLLPSIHIQQRIVSILDNANKIGELRREADELTKDFLKAVFLEMFGDPVRNTKKWQTQELRDVSTISRGRFSPRPRNDPKYFGGNYPFIQTGDISNSNHRLYKYTQTLNELGIKISKKFNKETVVIAIVGATIGETAILKINTYATDSIIGIIPNLKYLNSEYLEMSLRFWQPIFKIQAPEVARPNINNETLKSVMMPIPPIELQNEYSSIVKESEQLIEYQKQSRKCIFDLFGNLMQKTFRGELTC